MYSNRVKINSFINSVSFKGISLCTVKVRKLTFLNPEKGMHSGMPEEESAWYLLCDMTETLCNNTL